MHTTIILKHIMHAFYFSIKKNRDGQFRAQNCKLYWVHKLVNQALSLGIYRPLITSICIVKKPANGSYIRHLIHRRNKRGKKQVRFLFSKGE